MLAIPRTAKVGKPIRWQGQRYILRELVYRGRPSAALLRRSNDQRLPNREAYGVLTPLYNYDDAIDPGWQLTLVSIKGADTRSSIKRPELGATVLYKRRKYVVEAIGEGASTMLTAIEAEVTAGRVVDARRATSSSWTLLVAGARFVLSSLPL